MKIHKTRYLKFISILIASLLFSGCGGGNGGNDEPLVSVPPTLEWQEDVYPNPDSLRDYCESPRSSSASFNSPDKTGSVFLEKMWLRSWSEDIYLWYRELSDFDVDLVDTPREYFNTRKTNAITPSGVPRDQFHFFVDTVEFEQQVSTGASLGYGMTINLLETSPPRKAVVTLVEPNSPADLANIVRGTEITAIDGADLIFGNDIDTLNNGLFPNTENENHTFTVIEPGNITPRVVTLNSATIVENPVQNTSFFTESDTAEKVGYLTLNTFGTFIAEESLVDSFSYLADNNVSDLVLDLRYNGGGLLAISSQLAYMIAGQNNSQGKTFYNTVFNDKYTTTDPVSGDRIQPFPFINMGIGVTTVPTNTNLPTLNLNRVFVLATESTCSASEALINGLQGIGVEVILIGGKTCGKPYGFRGTGNCGTTYFTIMFRGENEIGFGDYPDGFYPTDSANIGSVPVAGCEVADDYANPLGNLNEAMLKTALHYRDFGSCPIQNTFTTARKLLPTQRQIGNEGDLLNDDRVRSKMMLKQMLLRDYNKI